MKRINYKQELYFQNNISELENSLPPEYREKGLLGLAIYLVEYYLTNYYNTGECQYILQKKAYIVLVELLIWLTHNYFKCRNINFNFREEFKKANRKIFGVKKKIYQKWLTNKFPDEINILSKTLNTTNNWETSPKATYLSLIEQYIPFNIKDKKYLQKELGL